MTFEDGDPAENPWVSGKPRLEDIEIKAYSPEWLKQFELAKNLIAEVLSRVARNIEHIGSTAVPNLCSKPVIDIDLIVPDPEHEDDYVPALVAVGYELTVRERSWYGHRMLRYDSPRINLHVFGPGCPEHIRHILFRDWLRNHPEDRACYANKRKKQKKVLVTFSNIIETKKKWCVKSIGEYSNIEGGSKSDWRWPAATPVIHGIKVFWFFLFTKRIASLHQPVLEHIVNKWTRNLSRNCGFWRMRRSMTRLAHPRAV